MRLVRLPRGWQESSWQAASSARRGLFCGSAATSQKFGRIPKELRFLLRQYIDNLRETLARDRHQGLLEAVVLDRLGRALSARRAGGHAIRALGASALTRMQTAAQAVLRYPRRDQPVRPLRLQRGTLERTWQLVMPARQSPGFVRQYLDDLRETFARGRENGLLEIAMVDRIGRVFGAQTARRAVLLTIRMGQAVRRRVPGSSFTATWQGWVPTATVLLGILIAAALIRLWDIGSIGLRGDEAVYAGQAAVISGSNEMDRYFVLVSRGTSNFLLYQYVLSFIYFVFGVSDVSARVLSALFSTLTVLITFELGRTWYGRRVGLIAALLLAVSSYSVALGRLALLDATVTFFFALAVLCIAKWVKTPNQAWLFGFAAASSLAIQAKVTGGLVIPIFAIYLAITGQYRSLNIRRALLASLVFLAFFTPAFVQLASNGDQFVAFLSDSTGRVSKVPWHYYISKVASYEGYPLLALWVAGLALAIKKRTSGDLLAIIWILVVVAFLQANRLKGFNYLLPIIPAFSLLAARALAAMMFFRFGPRTLPGPNIQTAGTAVLSAVLLGSILLPLNGAIHRDAYAGLREAGDWLESNTPPDAGVMTISHGSAQYALAFYANRDSYPFGRFRLATVLPGGTVLEPSQSPKGTPTDWLYDWPPRLIEDRTVSYLVYYTEAGDDPPEDPIVDTPTQSKFRKLIEAYGGRLVHTVYHNNEPRVWIYRVGKLLPKPQITFSRIVFPADSGTSPIELLRVEGSGFLMNSKVGISYHLAPITTFPTDVDGSFSAMLGVPKHPRSLYYLRVVDEAGNYASSTGKHIWGVGVDEDATLDGAPAGGGVLPGFNLTGFNFKW